jgi:hypothetical protein
MPMFTPLKVWATSRKSSTNHDPWVDLLELPELPARVGDLQWLPTERADEEILEDFDRAVEGATSGGLEQLADQLQVFLELLKLDPPYLDLTMGIDLEWWAHELAQEALSSELKLTLPHLAGSVQLGTFDLMSNGKFIGGLDASGTGVLRRLSAGERRWMDEALATASLSLRRWQVSGVDEARAMAELDEIEVIAALQGVKANIENLWRDKQYIGAAVLQPVLDIVGNLSAARQA